MPVLGSGHFKPRPLWEAGQARRATPDVAKPLHVLPGAMAQHGYRIGSRHCGSHRHRRARAVKYYAEFRGARISPYFPTPMAAARWLTDKIAA